MGRLAEVNQSTGIGVKLFDGATDQFPRARVYNAAGTEQTGAPWNSPINLTHRANGFYSASVTPDVEGEFFVVIRVFSEGTYTTLNKKYEEVMEIVSVRSVDQDLATLLSRLTATRAGYLDNLPRLDVDVSTRESEASAASRHSTNISEHDATQAAVAAVNADTDDIQAKIGTPVTTLAGDIATRASQASVDVIDGIVDAILLDTDSLDSVKITTTRANNLDFLDVAVSSRLAAASYTAPDNAGIAAIQAKTDQLVFTGGRVDAVISTAQEAAIVDQVWDESLAAHVTVGSMGFNQNLLDDIFADTDSLDTTKLTTARANNLDFLDVAVSSRASQASVDVIDSLVDAIKVVTDQITFTGGLVDAIAQTVADKTGYALTPAEHEAIAVEVESHLLDEGDGQMLLNAIVSAIGNQNVDEIALVAAIRADLERVGGHTDLIKAKTDQLAFTGGRVNSVISTTQEDALVDKIWDELLVSHAVVGSTGEALTAAGAAAASPATIAAAVWDSLLSAHNTAGTFGFQANRIDDIETKVDTVNTKADQIVTQTNSTSIAQSVWNAARSSYTVVGSFGEALQGVLSSARATLLDNLSRLDVVVSTRAQQATVDTIANDTNTLLSRLTTTRASNLDRLDVNVSTRATQASVTALPSLTQIVNGVWDEPNASHVTAGTTGKSLFDSGAVTSPAAIADAVWDELRAGHVAAGSFGEILDAKISTRATQASLDAIAGAGFNAATDTLEKIRDKIDTLPTTTGDATLANQNTIISALALKASQASVNTLQSSVNAIPTNPLLTTDVRLNNLDAAISSRLSTVDFNVIKGGGFNASTDTLEAIRDAIAASVDLTPVLNQFSIIKGAGFDGGTDTLEAIRNRVEDTKSSADAALAEAILAKNAALGAATSAQATAIAAAVSAIPTNPVLDSDIRIARLDVTVSSRASQTSLDEIKGGTFNPATDSLEKIVDLINSKTYGNATLANQAAILSALGGKADQTTLLAVQNSVSLIPTNPLLTTDVRLNNLDAAITTRASAVDMALIKGGGFNGTTDSLEAIRDAIAAANLDLTPVLNQLNIIKGAGFSPVEDNLDAINSTAQTERAQIKADTQALLAEGEGV